MVYETASYVALFDSPVELKWSMHPVERHQSTNFSLSTYAVVGEKSVLTFQMNPSSDADLSLAVTINDASVKTVLPRGGVSRTVTEIINANILKSQNNTILFEVLGGSGSVKFSDVVLWFYTELPRPI